MVVGDLFSQTSNTKLINDLKIEESRLLELAQQFRQQLLKSNVMDTSKKSIDSDFQYVIDQITLAYSFRFNSLEERKSNVGNILEKGLIDK